MIDIDALLTDANWAHRSRSQQFANPYHDASGRFASHSGSALDTLDAHRTWLAGGSLSKSEMDAVQLYTMHAHVDINRGLRQNNRFLEPSSESQAMSMMDAIDKAPRVSSPMTVYRFGRLPDVPRGTVFRDHAFVSTSTRPDAFYDADHPHKFEIRVPSGSRGLSVKTISLNPTEDEFILQAGTSFRKIDDRIVEVIPE